MLREIVGRRAGPDAPVFVIAEIGLNHGGSIAPFDRSDLDGTKRERAVRELLNIVILEASS